MARRDTDEPEDRGRNRRSGIGDARAFTPRGRTTRDGGSGADSAADPQAEAELQRRRAELRMVRGGRAEEGRPPQRLGRVTGAPSRRPRRADDEGDFDVEEAPRRRTAAAGRGRPAVRADREFVGRTQAARARSPYRDDRLPAGRGRPQDRRQRPVAPPPDPPKMGEPRRRLRLATALSLLLFAAIGVRLVQFQLADAPAFAAQGLEDRLDTIKLPAPRGGIFDRTGAVLAQSVEARFVAVDPELVVEPQTTAGLLAPLLGKAPSEIEPLLQKGKQEVSGKPIRFRWLLRGLSVDTANMVRALKLPGIIVDRDERRDHPGHDLAANLIGFTGTDLNGLAGIEARYDQVLRGRNGQLQYETGNGQLNKPIPGGFRRETPAQPGSSLTLTIDRDVQFQAQHILAASMEKVKAVWGAAVVLDARTGEVVAQASHPTFDAANPNEAKPEVLADNATSVVVDPGSVHKAIVLSAALQENVIEPDSTVKIGPSIKKGDQVYWDTHQFAEGTRITLPGLMAYSSNVATIKIAEKLGAEKLYEYQKLFGLGQPTGIGVPGESSGQLQAPEDWSGTSHGSIPIGHEMAVTPLQMAAAYAAIANDGVWVQPHLIKQTIAPGGKVTEPAPPKSHRVVSAENAAALREIMEAVTTVDQATGRSAALPGYRISGKTGTGSQVLNGKYVKGEVGSFIGMAPAENPRYVVAVFVKTPGVGAGGKVAGPAFRDIMAYTLRHFKVLPSTIGSPKFVTYY
ncbi:peptidoglycan D,D-transpeptidase FtsI family protein [Catellatospora citrea]|uniref:Cell division protein n=1 Tax=Catellatospora citrea TaxID=53366 RepID=A0A8J3KEC4_9ACTN|nr:penicillin-binding protein 2 [Catellatospora citrea]RKE07116.1 peptidoglycan synthetase FtsI [Catellatospora citrea]GIF95268.1 cell division protein [Catellatospora citrea]